MKKRVIVSVINDLVTDQRVNKVCQTLVSIGCDVLLIGRQMKNSPKMDSRDYDYHRMKLFWERGPLFYAEFNLRLFCFLLFRKSDMLISNDLDTLLPNFIVSRIRKIPLVYDSHEYFTEVPELVSRKRVQNVWKYIERRLFPRLTDTITVNDSIAQLFERDYGIKPTVVRNIPRRIGKVGKFTRDSLGLPDNVPILILQGSGINVQRGVEELIEAMVYVNDAVLLIIGGGDVINKLKEMVDYHKLGSRVLFKPRLPYEEMMKYTSLANLGLTLDKPHNLNYLYSLPNKLFDYIQAGVPVLSSHLPELEKIIKKYNIGDFIPDHHPKNIAKKINHILSNQDLMHEWKKNCIFASKELVWENEEKSLIKIYKKYV